MNCSSTCPTQDHFTFGECIRAKGIQLGDVKGIGVTPALDVRLSAYDSARRQGIQPASTRLRDVNAAVRISERAGKAFDASTV